MDLEMPIMNGIIATEEIRAREASGKISGRIPIIAVTGNARAGYMDKGKSLHPKFMADIISIKDWYWLFHCEAIWEAGFDWEDTGFGEIVIGIDRGRVGWT